MDIKEARRRDRKRRRVVENEIRRAKLRRPNAEHYLPYNVLSNGMVVLDEASPEFAERLAVIRRRR